MAIPDGKPATDFSAMNREWVRAVAEEAAEAGGLPEVSGSDNGKVLTVVSGEWEAATPAASGIPAPADPSDGDVLTYSSTDSAWVAAAPSGGGGNILTVIITQNQDEKFVTDKTASEILAAYTNGYFIYLQNADSGEGYAQYYMWYVASFGFDDEQEEYKYVMTTTAGIEFSASSGNSTMTEVSSWMTEVSS